MMLTLNTAREMGVTSRLDATQSLEGGTAYLTKLKRRLVKRIREPDRTLLALAAYNVGFGHLEDARILTQRGGKNPDLWRDVREFLPLLSHREYYSKSKYGYARGAEPVLYVDNIQYYQHYLQLHSISKQQKTVNQTDVSNKEKDWEGNKLPGL
jgi:membrane-bound lytic murein transglycosylase F